MTVSVNINKVVKSHSLECSIDEEAVFLKMTFVEHFGFCLTFSLKALLRKRRIKVLLNFFKLKVFL